MICSPTLIASAHKRLSILHLKEQVFRRFQIKRNQSDDLLCVGYEMLNRFDPETREWRAIETINFEYFQQLLEIRAYQVDQLSRQWVIDRFFIYLFLPNDPIPIIFRRNQLVEQDLGNMMEIHIDPTNRPWFATSNGVLKLEADSPEFLQIRPAKEGFNKIHLDENQQVWATSIRDLSRLTNHQFEKFSTPANKMIFDVVFRGSDPHALLVENLEWRYRPAPLKQIYFWRKDDNIWQEFEGYEAIAGKLLQSNQMFPLHMFQTSDRTIWVNGYRGTIRISPDRTIDRPEQMPLFFMNKSSLLETAQGRILASDAIDIYEWQAGHERWFVLDQTDFPFIPDRLVETGDSTLWINSQYALWQEGRLAKFEGNQWNIVEPWDYGSDNNSIRSIGKTLAGDLWVVGHHRNIGLFNGTDWELIETPNWQEAPLKLQPFDPPIPNPDGPKEDWTFNDFVTFFYYKDQLWITGENLGTFLFDPVMSKQRVTILGQHQLSE